MNRLTNPSQSSPSRAEHAERARRVKAPQSAITVRKQAATSGVAAPRNAVTTGVTPFTMNAPKYVQSDGAPSASAAAPPRAAATVLPGLSQFTPAGIDYQTAIAYARVAETKNEDIDFLYNQAHENWELNYRRGPEPVKPAYHETRPDKIFNHLQSFRYGDIAIPDNGSGYLSVDGFVSASPHQQQYGQAAVLLTSYTGSAYEQVSMPSNPATPDTATIFWGKATLPLKKNG